MGRVVMLIGSSQPTTWEKRIGQEREGKKNVISLLFQATQIIEMTAFLQTRLADSFKLLRHVS